MNGNLISNINVHEIQFENIFISAIHVLILVESRIYLVT